MQGGIIDYIANILKVMSFKEVERMQCDDCRHHIYNYCYMKNNCYYEPILSCEGCVDQKKRKFKGTECLHCKRYCYNPDVIVEEIQDYYRK